MDTRHLPYTGLLDRIIESAARRSHPEPERLSGASGASRTDPSRAHDSCAYTVGRAYADQFLEDVFGREFLYELDEDL